MTRMSLTEDLTGLVDLRNGPGVTTIPVPSDVRMETRLDCDEASDMVAIEVYACHDGVHIHTEAHLDWDAVRRLHALLSALISVRGTVE